jgi:hypothetical protein
VEFYLNMRGLALYDQNIQSYQYRYKIEDSNIQEINFSMDDDVILYRLLKYLRLYGGVKRVLICTTSMNKAMQLGSYIRALAEKHLL